MENTGEQELVTGCSINDIADSDLFDESCSDLSLFERINEIDFEQLRSGDNATWEEFEPLAREFVKIIVISLYGQKMIDFWEDIFQEIMCKILTTESPYKSTSNAKFTTWLRVVIVNACISHFRCEQRRPTSSLDALVGDREGISDLIPSEMTNWEYESLKVDLERLLSMIDGEDALILRLISQGFPYQEIAKILGVNLSTVKSKIRRARQRAELQWKASGGEKDFQ
ncbi:MAG: RNA polymerase sigma factor [Patescibacteria group bacterium]|nr:RNA polymerase sigma factor [Patescibacteria group bacterium]